jgi:hypothetical protein
VPVAVPLWARFLDRHRVLAFRARHARVTMAAVILFGSSVMLEWPWLLVPAAILLGVSTAAGSLGWTLAHNEFAPRGEETRYMALHVTLTGMRGLLAPPATMGAYHLLEYAHAGAGPGALGIPLALVASGAWRFHRMRRSQAAQAPA